MSQVISPASASGPYQEFLRATEPSELSCYGCFFNLDRLTDLAAESRTVVELSCPFSDDRQAQWKFDRLSEIKERLAHAIERKSEYYDTTLLGIVTQLFLKLFCLWNGGSTPTIQRAIDFEFFWDSEFPLMRISNREHPRFGECVPRNDFPPRNVDVSSFYNFRTR